MGNTVAAAAAAQPAAPPPPPLFFEFDFEAAEASVAGDAASLSALAVGLARGADYAVLLGEDSTKTRLNSCALAQETFIRIALAHASAASASASSEEEEEEEEDVAAQVLALIERPFVCAALVLQLPVSSGGRAAQLDQFLARCLVWLLAEPSSQKNTSTERIALELQQAALASLNTSNSCCYTLGPQLPQVWFELLFRADDDNAAAASSSLSSLVLDVFATAVLVGALRPSQVWDLVQAKQNHAVSYALMFLACSACPELPIADNDNTFARFVFAGLLTPRDDKFAFGLLQLCAPTEDDQFRTLLSLCQLLDDDTAVHLLAEPFEVHLPSLLLQVVATEKSGVSWSAYSLEWTCALLARGLRNANAEVVKFMLAQVLVRCSSSTGSPPLPAWFVAQHLLPRLQIEDLYSPTMFEATGAFRVQPTAVATGRTQAKKKYAEAQGTTVFNLPDALFEFLRLQPASDLLAYFRVVVAVFKSLSAACVCVEALTRALLLLEDAPALSDAVMQDWLKIVALHGTHAGQAMKRGNMITGCLLRLAVQLADERQLLTLVRATPDYFLELHSSIRLSSSGNFMAVLGSASRLFADQDARRQLPPADKALLYVAQLAVAKEEEEVAIVAVQEDDEDDEALAFAYRVLQLVPMASAAASSVFPAAFVQRLERVCLHRIGSALSSAAPSPSLLLLEDAWSEGGQSKARESTKLHESNGVFAALHIAARLAFKSRPVFESARQAFLQQTDELARLKALVVLSVLFEEDDQKNNNAVVERLCGMTERLPFVLSEEQRQQTTEQLLWCEFEERKWRVLRLASATASATVREAAQLQLDAWEVNSDAVNCHALSCLLESSSQSGGAAFDGESFARFIDHTDFYRTSTVEMQHVLLRHTGTWLDSPRTLRRLLQHKHLAVGFAKRLAAVLFQRVWRVDQQQEEVDAQHPAEGYEDEIFLLLAHVDRVWELQDYSAHEASRTVRVAVDSDVEQHFICRSTKTIHPASFVAFACLSWLDAQAKQQQQPDDQSFVRSMASRLVRKLFTLGQFETKIFSVALLVCSPAACAEELVPEVLQLLSKGGLPPETKENLEMTLVRLISRDKPALLGELATVLASHKHQNNGYLVMSLLSVASIAWRVSSNEDGEEDEETVNDIMLRLALPWMGCAKSSIRILATNICLTVSDRRRRANGGGGVSVSEELELLLAPMRANGQMVRLMQRVSQDQDDNAVLYLELDLVKLLETRDFNLFGDLCPQDLKVDKIAEFVRMGQEEFFAEFDVAEQGQEEEEKAVGAVAEAAAPGPLRFQRKITRPLLPSSSSSSSRARKRNLIVVASMVDKIPNLAGLARTCEVFSARTLVMERNPADIIGLAEFKTISRTAENWLPMISVKRGPALREYLSQLRKEHGYLIVGLEQTSDSVLLQDFDAQWPAHGRVCIVLGAEGTGIPPDVLTCLDRTIEIPQQGHIKSLNVHVSGAMCVWAYTQAMIRMEASNE